MFQKTPNVPEDSKCSNALQHLTFLDFGKEAWLKLLVDDGNKIAHELFDN